MPATKLKNLKDLVKEQARIAKEREAYSHVVTISSGTCGLAKGSGEFVDAMKAAVKALGLGKRVLIKSTGCHGFCDIEPVVHIAPQGIVYQKVAPENAKEILSETVLRNNVLEKLLYTDPQTGQKARLAREIPFYKSQRRLLTKANAEVDPESLPDYIANGGYQALAKAVGELDPEKVIAEVKKSRLRGRGGAGFPTGFKWEFCRRAKGDVKYVICNADEGDPGAYMDRSLLEGNPHATLEGMAIGAFAIGASEGYIYVRHEYPMAVRNIRKAVEDARAAGLLGKNILGGKFSFDVHIERGAGAFVCGEETALISSVEGKRGEPRQRPPFPAVRGLWGKPTNINNVETWSSIPVVINKGGDWFARIGTESSGGTKIFSLVGKVAHTGLVEVPIGTTLREIIYDIGGGIKGDGEFKAVQTGGPSGGCLPRSMLDLPVDYDTLAKAGSIMGSGGMIVMDESTCMVDLAKYFLNFLRDESCGKCLSCREGTDRLHEIVARICDGKGTEEDLPLLEELALVVKDASMCGLGQTAPNPVLSTLRYFRKEYEAHIKEKRCPAGVCKALIKYSIDGGKCIGCAVCAKQCPVDAISGEFKKPHAIDADRCIRCGVCVDACKPKAILVA
ncbi:MAG: NADH-quinone oxidoreductase subunit NuoF [Elusimicrobia bacterium]|nr:NADH-quinone oxidoreductase subunit NuoF [Elusimicrobiota bacterium]